MNVAKGDLLLVLGREMDKGRRERGGVVTIGRAQQHRDVRVGQRDEREGREKGDFRSEGKKDKKRSTSSSRRRIKSALVDCPSSFCRDRQGVGASARP